MGSEGGCSASSWASLILMLEMESVTSVTGISIVEAIAVAEGDQLLTATTIQGSSSKYSGVR